VSSALCARKSHDQLQLYKKNTSVRAFADEVESRILESDNEGVWILLSFVGQIKPRPVHIIAAKTPVYECKKISRLPPVRLAAND
jgi:hypothetical protein